MRKSFAPGFSILVSILKKDALKQQGRIPSEDKRNVYTEEDKDIMTSAWEMATAYRDFLLPNARAVSVTSLRASRRFDWHRIGVLLCE